MFRWFTWIGILLSTWIHAADPVISDVRLIQDGTLTFSLAIEPISGNPEFKVLSATSVTTRADMWTEIPAINQTLLEDATWFIQLPAPLSGIGFYRVIVTESIHLPDNSPVILSEICSANTSLLPDKYGDYSDWIELHNRGNSPISLTGWTLSDDTSDPGKWVFPHVTLNPDEWRVVFASGKDRRDPSTELHTSFRISSNGEVLLLSDAKGAPKDAIRVGPLNSDTTLGRPGLDAQGWLVFQKESTTPGSPNKMSGAVFVEAPTFSQPAGFHPTPKTLRLSTLSLNQSIRYSVNGTDPWDEGLDYETPIILNQTTAVRAVSIDQNGERSAETTGTFFINSPHSLAVVSLVAPANNFNIHDGYLYGFGEHMFNNRRNVTANFPYSSSNAWKDREIPVSFELFEPNGNRGFQQWIGIKIFGGWGSRGYPQKSLAFFARAEYGKGKVRYPLFPDLELDEFESFVLRNSGNDNQSTHQIPPRTEINAFGRRQSNGSYFVNGNYTLMRDAMMQRVAGNLNVDRQAYRPVVVYLNGDYWGIYNLREKLNEHYVASNHGVEPDQIDLIEGYGTANSGSSSHYTAMRNFMNGGSLASESRYAHVTETYLDVSSFTDYHLAVIYFQNFDIGNIKQWRNRNDGTFRWMLYDQDYGFNLWQPEVYLPAMKRDFADYDNMFEFYTKVSGSSTGWPNDSGRTFLLRKMLENDAFRIAFINRCADLLNTDFNSERVVSIIEEMSAVIRTEIPKHLARWSWAELLERNHGSPFDEEDAPLIIDQWETNIENLKTYARKRPSNLRADLIEHFKLTAGTFELFATVEPPDAGFIKINTITHQDLTDNKGIYFNTVPVTIEAIPNEGHQFQGWGNRPSQSPMISIETTSNDQIKVHAIFN